jgi:hypothetical protein
MLFVTAMFGGLMLLSVESRRRMVAVLLIACIAILGISPTLRRIGTTGSVGLEDRAREGLDRGMRIRGPQSVCRVSV